MLEHGELCLHLLDLDLHRVHDIAFLEFEGSDAHNILVRCVRFRVQVHQLLVEIQLINLYLSLHLAQLFIKVIQPLHEWNIGIDLVLLLLLLVIGLPVGKLCELDVDLVVLQLLLGNQRSLLLVQELEALVQRGDLDRKLSVYLLIIRTMR